MPRFLGLNQIELERRDVPANLYVVTIDTDNDGSVDTSIGSGEGTFFAIADSPEDAAAASANYLIESSGIVLLEEVDNDAVVATTNGVDSWIATFEIQDSPELASYFETFDNIDVERIGNNLIADQLIVAGVSNNTVIIDVRFDSEGVFNGSTLYNAASLSAGAGALGGGLGAVAEADIFQQFVITANANQLSDLYYQYFIKYIQACQLLDELKGKLQSVEAEEQALLNKNGRTAQDYARLEVLQQQRQELEGQIQQTENQISIIRERKDKIKRIHEIIRGQAPELRSF